MWAWPSGITAFELKLLPYLVMLAAANFVDNHYILGNWVALAKTLLKVKLAGNWLTGNCTYILQMRMFGMRPQRAQQLSVYTCMYMCMPTVTPSYS